MSNLSNYLFKYISGKLSEQEVKIVEKNDSFMKAAVKASKDPKIFDRCSEKLKSDGDFIVECVQLFWDKPEVVDDLVTDFCANYGQDFNHAMELNILASELYEETQDIRLKFFHNECELFYKKAIDDLLAEKMRMPADKSEEAGLGFIIVDLSFDHSEILNRFFAKRMIRDLFINHPMYSFEELLHYENDSKESLLKKGIKPFLLEFIGVEDDALRNYVREHSEYLEPYEDLANKYIENWDVYTELLNRTKIEDAQNHMETFLIDNNLPLNYMIMFRGIVDLSVNKDKITKYMEDEPYEKIDMNTLDFNEFRVVKHMKDYLDEAFTHDVEYDDMIFLEEDKQEEKVIKVDFKKRKRKDNQ